jgi:hypothetical protein
VVFVDDDSLGMNRSIRLFDSAVNTALQPNKMGGQLALTHADQLVDERFGS